jgi:hypothetical protein
MAFHNWHSGLLCKPIIALGKMLQKSKMDDYDHQCHQSSKVFASVATWTAELKFRLYNISIETDIIFYRGIALFIGTYYFVLKFFWPTVRKKCLVIESNFANLRLKIKILQIFGDLFLKFKLMIA